MKIIKGITWNHTRGIIPLQAGAQIYHERHPDVEIIWEKRSLQAFADAPLDTMSQNYDLLIIDHPHVGVAAHSKEILPISEYLDDQYLSDLEENSVGQSYKSYIFDEKLWALPVDAATPVSQYRSDLLKKFKYTLPQTWEDVIELAKHGYVVMPGIAINSLMDFYMFCVANGGNLFANNKVVEEEVGLKALDEIRKITQYLPSWCRDADPIKIYNYLSESDQEFYCPMAYGYSAYSMAGYSEYPVYSENIVSYEGKQLRSILGGTGLSVSSNCKHIEVALDYIKMIASEKFQRTVYVSSGGQPGHRKAWEDDYCNDITNDYFRNTLKSLDEAYLRPRYNRYLDFQDNAGALIFENRWNGKNTKEVLELLNKLYHQTCSPNENE